MTYRENISGPLGAAKGAFWGTTMLDDRIRHIYGSPDDGALLLFRYDTGLIRSSETFIATLAADEQTTFSDQIYANGSGVRGGRRTVRVAQSENFSRQPACRS